MTASLPKWLPSVDKTAPLPIYSQLKQQVSQAIAAGELAAGDRLPPIYELAKRLSVSPMTVRHAYLELESEGWLVARHGRGTFVSSTCPGAPAAEAPAGLRDIGLAIRNFSSVTAFALPMIQGAGRAAEELGAAVHLISTSGQRLGQDATACLDSLIESHRLGGVLVGGPLYAEDVDRLQRQRLPFVLLDADYHGSAHVHSVLPDDAAAVRALLQAALAAGRRRCGFLLGPPGDERGLVVRRAQRLRAGFLDEAARLGLEIDERRLRWCEYDETEARAVVAELLALPEPPDVLLVNGDIQARAVEAQLRDSGRRELLLLNYADSAASAQAVVVKPLAEMGRVAVELLARLARGEAAPLRTLLAPELVKERA